MPVGICGMFGRAGMEGMLGLDGVGTDGIAGMAGIPGRLVGPMVFTGAWGAAACGPMPGGSPPGGN